MDSAPGRHHGLGRAVARGDDQLRIVEIELFDGEREERQVMPIPSSGRGQALDQRRPHLPMLDGRAD
jgi:hypothetical protein